MSDILGSILGGALKGLAGQQEPSAGLPDILTQVLGRTDLGNVGGLLRQLQQSGLGEQVASWLGNGENLPVSIDQLKNALGEVTLGQLASQFGVPAEELLRRLSQHLPDAVSRLSPSGAPDGTDTGSLARDLGPE